MARNIIPYSAKLKMVAVKLRKQSTLGEILLWKRLRKKQLQGFDFHRQKPLFNYIVDFFCAELGLVIEIDGKYHAHSEQSEKDYTRDKELRDAGLQIVRFNEHDIRYHLDDCIMYLDKMVSIIKEHH